MAIGHCGGSRGSGLLLVGTFLHYLDAIIDVVKFFYAHARLALLWLVDLGIEVLMRHDVVVAPVALHDVSAWVVVHYD